MLDPAGLSELSQLLRERAPEAERRGRLSKQSVKELSECGVFRALVPACYEGMEGSLSQLLENLVELGRCCPSTAWVASLFAIHSVIVAWFPPAAQQSVWAGGPDARIGSSLAPMGELRKAPGGVRLSGRWSFASGIDHAQWLLLGARRETHPILLLISAGDARVEDDWQVAGLSGSGSKSLMIDDLFVPNDHTLAMAAVESGKTPGASMHTGPLYGLPWRPLFSYAFVPPLLGAALAALDECGSYFQGRKSAFTGLAFKDRSLAWTALARATGEVDAAVALMRRDLAELESAAIAGPAERALVLRASFNPALIGKLCRSAVNRLFHASGASMLYTSHPLQRHFRDVHAMSQHPALNFDLACETYGRALLETGPDLINPL